MKKILLLLVLTFMVGAVNAKTDKFACNQTISDSYSWTASGNEICLFDNILDVDKSKYRKLHIKFSNKENISFMQVRVMCNGNYSTASWHNDYYSSSDITIDLTEQTYKDENATATDRTYSEISRIYLKAYSSDASKEASYNISKDDIYLETAEYEAMEISTPIAELYWYNYSTGDSYDRTASALKKQLNTSVAGNNQVLYGPYNGSATVAYMDVAGYDNAVFTLNTAGTPGIRLIYNTSTITIETDNTKTSYTQSVSAMQKIATIKTKYGSGDVSFNIKSIIFTKDFDAASTTAFEIAASSGSTVAYDRTFPTDKKSTVCLPFALTEAEVTAAGTFYELTSAAGGTLTFSEVSETEAYKPYVFEAKTANPFASLTNKTIEASADATTSYTVDGYTFQGTLAHQSLLSGVYGYNAANGVFSVTTTNAVTIDAFRGYITTSSGNSARALRCVFGNEITGINEVKSQKAEENDVLYSPSGQRVSADYKGIVIKNGRKYFKE